MAKFNQKLGYTTVECYLCAREIHANPYAPGAEVVTWAGVQTCQGCFNRYADLKPAPAKLNPLSYTFRV